jgi:hypothetical protein
MSSARNRQTLEARMLSEERLDGTRVSVDDMAWTDLKGLPGARGFANPEWCSESSTRGAAIDCDVTSDAQDIERGLR